MLLCAYVNHATVDMSGSGVRGLGRFMQTDPIGYNGGMNLYSYASGDPLNRRDPMGTTVVGVAGRSRRLHSDECGMGERQMWQYIGKNVPDGSVPMPKSEDIYALIHTHPSWGYAFPGPGDYDSAKNYAVYNINPSGAWVLRHGTPRGQDPEALVGPVPRKPPNGAGGCALK